MRRQLPVPIMQRQTSPCKDPSKDPLKLHAHVLDTPHASLRKDQQGCLMLHASSKLIRNQNQCELIQGLQTKTSRKRLSIFLTMPSSCKRQPSMQTIC